MSHETNTHSKPVFPLPIKLVQLFHTCIINEIYPEVGMSVVKVLEHLGIKVEVPMNQTCCGQPAFNAGFHNDAKKVAKHTLDLLLKTEGPIVIPSGSCGDMLTHQYQMLFAGSSADDQAYLKKTEIISSRCFEFSMFLVDVLGITNLIGQLDIKVAYHPSCHLLRGLGATTQAKALLAGVSGLSTSKIHDEEECCGFGGMFSIKNAAISEGMMQNKLKHLSASGADCITSCDMGCLMHLEGGLHRNAKEKIKTLEVKHLAQILEQALSKS